MILISKLDIGSRYMDLLRSTFRAFIRLHVLHHACEGEFYGAWMAGELARHGYRISPGSLYPMLREMTQAGLLSCRKRLVNGRVRKYYRATAHGRHALEHARAKVAELAGEVLRTRGKKQRKTDS